VTTGELSYDMNALRYLWDDEMTATAKKVRWLNLHDYPRVELPGDRQKGGHQILLLLGLPHALYPSLRQS